MKQFYYWNQISLPISLGFETKNLIRIRQKFVQGQPNTFFLENALKKTTGDFLKFIFLFESTILPVNNGI